MAMNNPTPLCLDFNEALDMAQRPEIESYPNTRGMIIMSYSRQLS